MNLATRSVVGCSIFFACFFYKSANAWIPAGEVSTVVEVITWAESVSNVMAFKLSSGIFCYVDKSQTPLFSEITAQLMTAYASGKKVEVHCHDATTNIAGYNAHRLHRLISWP